MEDTQAPVTIQDAKARLASLREQEKALLVQVKEQEAKERQEKQDNMDVLTDTLAQACEGLEDAIAYFGGRVPLLLSVGEDGKAKVEGRFSSPSTGQVLSVGVRHGKVRIDGKDYPSLNSGASFLYPDAGKKGTEAWKGYLARRNHSVEFVE